MGISCHRWVACYSTLWLIGSRLMAHPPFDGSRTLNWREIDPHFWGTFRTTGNVFLSAQISFMLYIAIPYFDGGNSPTGTITQVVNQNVSSVVDSGGRVDDDDDIMNRNCSRLKPNSFVRLLCNLEHTMAIVWSLCAYQEELFSRHKQTLEFGIGVTKT